MRLAAVADRLPACAFSCRGRAYCAHGACARDSANRPRMSPQGAIRWPNARSRSQCSPTQEGVHVLQRLRRPPSSHLQASSPDLSADLDFRKPDRIRQFRAPFGIASDHLSLKLLSPDSFYECGHSNRLVILFLHHGRPSGIDCERVKCSVG